MSNLPPPPGGAPEPNGAPQPPPFAAPPPTYGQPAYGQPTYGQPYGAQPYGGQAQPKYSGLAIAGMVLGICGIVLFCFYGVPGLVGLPLSIVGLMKINSSGGMLKGKGMAIAGIITSSIAVLMGILLTIAVIADAGNSSSNGF